MRTSCSIQSTLKIGLEEASSWRVNRKLQVFTVDGERGRRLRLADHVLRHAGVGADVGRDETTYLQGVVFTDLISEKREGHKP